MAFSATSESSIVSTAPPVGTKEGKATSAASCATLTVALDVRLTPTAIPASDCGSASRLAAMSARMNPPPGATEKCGKDDAASNVAAEIVSKSAIAALAPGKFCAKVAMPPAWASSVVRLSPICRATPGIAA